jgi:ubiquinone biosynthesis monooxygenase Coq6
LKHVVSPCRCLAPLSTYSRERRLYQHHSLLPTVRRDLIHSNHHPIKENNSYPTDNSKIYDIVIVGGGIVGSALACTLGSTSLTQHLRVALLETGTVSALPSPLPEQPDVRVSAFSPLTISLFKAIGVWSEIERTRVTPYYDMKVWDSLGPSSIHFIHKDFGLSELGFIIENNIVQSALLQHLHNFPNITLFPQTTVDSIHFGSTEDNDNKASAVTNAMRDWVVVKTKSGMTLQTRLLVGADGANSAVRVAAKISTAGYSYNQIGVVATVQHPKSIKNTTAWQRFLPYGPLALLPLWDSLSSIVYSTSPHMAEYLLSLPDNALAEELNKAFKSPFESTSPIKEFSFIRAIAQLPIFGHSDYCQEVPEIVGVVGKRAAYPLRFLHASKYVAHRCALIGDAGHVIHPLAGQGISLGFSDVISLANHIIEAVETGQDIGSATVLEKYDRERKFYVVPIITSLNLLKELFAAQSSLIVAARNFGLSFVNSFFPLKNIFHTIASGGNVSLSKIGRSSLAPDNSVAT